MTRTYINPSATTGVELSLENLVMTAISPTQLAANTDNWNPTGLATASIIRVSTDASRNLTGITAPAAAKVLVLENVGAFDLVLKHDVTSTPANRFFCPNDTDVTLQKDSAIVVQYDMTSSRWRVVGGTGSGTTGAANTIARVTAESTADLAIPASPTLATIQDITLGAGTWVIVAVTRVYAASNAPFHVYPSLVDITNTVTLQGSTEIIPTNNYYREIVLLSDIVLTASATIRFRITGDATGGHALGGTGNSRITAIPGVLPLAGSTGPLLGYNACTSGSFSTPSTTLADVDATNMKVTFVAPPSGTVMVRLTAYTDMATGSFGYWSLRDGSTNVAGAGGAVTRGDGAGAVDNGGVRSITFPMTGLTPGTSYTWKWSWANNTGATDMRILVGTGGKGIGPALMEVYDAATPAATSGTAFPVSPVTSQRFFRTDLGSDYRYDGSQWLSTDLRTMTLGVVDQLHPVTTTTDILHGPVPDVPTSIYLTSVAISVIYTGTNDGSNYWEWQLKRTDSANASTAVGSAVNTSGDGAGTKDVRKLVSLNVVLDTSARWMRLAMTKVGTPSGGVYATALITYRHIAT